MPLGGPVRVPFAQDCNINAYIRALPRIEKAIAADCRELILDFTYTERAYPDGMVPLISTLARIREDRDLSVSIRLPKRSNIAGVFEGVGWPRYLIDPDAAFELPNHTPKFTPIRPFHDLDELEALHGSLLNVLTSQARLATNLPEALEWALWEVMENVLNHASVRMGWVQASSFPESRRVNLIVVDSGVGIRQSLSQAYPGISDQEAIKKAVEQGVTRDPEVGAGFGLWGCRQIVRSNRGMLVAYSGATMLVEMETRTPAAPQGSKIQQVGSYRVVGAEHMGTVVELDLRSDRPVSPWTGESPVASIELHHASGDELVFSVAKEARNLGTRVAGRLLRTRIMNLWQAVPDENLVLDFAGASMVSSSFADELVAKLAMALGASGSYDRLILRSMSPPVKTIVRAALQSRLMS